MPETEFLQTNTSTNYFEFNVFHLESNNKNKV